MGKVAAVLSVVLAFAAEGLFLLTGAGRPLPEPTSLADALGADLAGQPVLAAVGALLFLLGVGLAARPTEAGGPFAHREAAFAVSVAVAWAFAVAVALGVARGWSRGTVAGLGAGGVVESVVALGFALRVAVASDKRKLLFVPALLGAVAVATLLGVGVTLGAV